MAAKVIVNCDGASRGNPGKASIGIVVWDVNRNVLDEHKEKIGVTTNNIAEYNSLLSALDIASDHTHGEVQVYMDSEVVIRQMKGEYRVKKPHLRKLYDEVKDKESMFMAVIYSNVPRDDRYQAEADRLANEALDGI
ncbi:MAG: ribonuclease HI family protein [Candidatus Woesearchaeota archaeon]